MAASTPRAQLISSALGVVCPNPLVRNVTIAALAEAGRRTLLTATQPQHSSRPAGVLSTSVMLREPWPS
jgi:hypothetical protein